MNETNRTRIARDAIAPAAGRPISRPASGNLGIAVDTAAPTARPISDNLRIAVDTTDPTAARPISDNLRIAVDTTDHGRSISGNLRIAVDFDGVLFDHIPYLLRGFRDAHGIDLAAEGLAHWDFFQYRAVRDRNLTWACVKTVLEKIDNDPALHDVGLRDADAAGVIARWRAAGHRVSLVTAREPRGRATVEAFLARNGVAVDEVVMGAVKKTGYDVLVDDAPHNVLMAAADGGMALLMDQPYNRDVPTKRNPLRVRTWRDVEETVARHAPEAMA